MKSRLRDTGEASLKVKILTMVHGPKRKSQCETRGRLESSSCVVPPRGLFHIVSQHLSLVLVKAAEEELGWEGLRVRHHSCEKPGFAPGCRVDRMQQCLAAIEWSVKSQGRVSMASVGNGGAEPPPCGREVETEGKDETVFPVLVGVRSTPERSRGNLVVGSLSASCCLKFYLFSPHRLAQDWRQRSFMSQDACHSSG